MLNNMLVLDPQLLRNEVNVYLTVIVFALHAQIDAQFKTIIIWVLIVIIYLVNIEDAAQ